MRVEEKKYFSQDRLSLENLLKIKNDGVFFHHVGINLLIDKTI